MSRVSKRIMSLQAELAEVEALLANAPPDAAVDMSSLTSRASLLRWEIAAVTSSRRSCSLNSRNYEAKRIANGGRRFPGTVMPPEAASAIDSLRNAGYAANTTQVLVRALMEAVERQRAGEP